MQEPRTRQGLESAVRVRLEGVALSFGKRSVFRDLSARFPRGRISVIMGGSGSGKSTLLRLVAGLVRPDRGSVHVAEQDVTALSESELFRVRERIGMLFQHGALLDSLTVFDNVALPLREHTNLSEPDVAAEVERRLAAVGLPEVGGQLPRELSGGMLRRAALARAIVSDPEIVLCDEPFSGLDPLNVRRIEKLLVTLNRQLGLTLLVTSHHVPSSLRMAHQVVFLAEGRALTGTPEAMRGHSDPTVSGFFAAELDTDAVVENGA